MKSTSLIKLRKIVKYTSILLIAIVFSSESFAQPVDYGGRFQVLLVTKSLVYDHASILDGVQMFRELSKKNKFGLTWTQDSEPFNNQAILDSMEVIVFLNTSGDILESNQKKAFQKYIRNGGNFVGIHCAAFTMMDWPWFVKLLGGVWNRHPNPGVNIAKVNVEDPDHPSTYHLPSSWIVTDEWYNFVELSDNNKVLLTVDEDTYPGGKMPDYHPVAWYQKDFEGGRSFYTMLGHPAGIYTNPWYRQHILGAIWWAATGGKAEE